MNVQKKRKVLGPCAVEFTAANTGSWRLERPVLTAERCVRCGICSRYCPTDCITVSKQRDEAPLSIDLHYCKGCGICVNECPKGALEFVNERGAD